MPDETRSLDQLDEIISQAVDELVAKVPGSGTEMAEYLIRKQLWDHLTEVLHFGADELREKADEIEQEAEEDDDGP